MDGGKRERKEIEKKELSRLKGERKGHGRNGEREIMENKCPTDAMFLSGWNALAADARVCAIPPQEDPLICIY